MANTSPVIVVRHDISDSVQTRSSSGIVRVVKSADEIAQDVGTLVKKKSKREGKATAR